MDAGRFDRKGQEVWRAVNDEQDAVRRWVLRMALCIAGLSLVVPVLWLLISHFDQFSFVWTNLLAVMVLALVASVLWEIVKVVARARHRMAMMGLPNGLFRAAMWSFTHGDGSIRVGYLLTALFLFMSGTGVTVKPPDDNSFLVWIAWLLIVRGELPKDRFLRGRRHPEPAWYRKACVLIGVLAVPVFLQSVWDLWHCSCSGWDAVRLALVPFYVILGFFAICLWLRNMDDLARSQRTVASRAANSAPAA
ncbi:hypothetical protein DK847_10580 [Aestuariivirga litoralis]|uniref:Uncharacterized protein n=2 Tax=Aestuariivirga litoralis TaxID=2650924 RepID=A0A2W2BKY5_9HYPH|nr:hypothetical protein DK847_10580 [Aestuariivirga litoralis]